MSEKFDNRVVHHHLRRGVLSQADYDAYLKSLPDDAEHAEPTETEFVASWANRGAAGEDAPETAQE